MKRLLLLLLPLILSAQVIDTIISFTDGPTSLLYIPDGNELYTQFSNHILVLDCSTYQVKNTIFISGSQYGIWNWRRNKIYYTCSPLPESIAVIDNTTDSIIKWINFGSRFPPCYNSNNDKVYVINGSSVGVVDCEIDSIIKIIPPQPHFLTGFVLWDSIGNKVYCGSGLFEDEVTVINCANDSVISIINTMVITPDEAVYNIQRRKLYVAGEWDFYGAVIDVVGDTLIKNFYPIGFDFWMTLIWNSQEDKVYWPDGDDGDTMLIIDCLTDSIIKRVAPGGQLECMCLAPWSNRLYFISTDYDSAGSYNILYVLDCQHDSVISQIRLGRNAQSIACNPQDHRIYIADKWDSVLFVIRDEIPVIEECQTLDAISLTPKIYPNPVNSVLRVRGPFSEKSIKIFDASGRLIKEIATTASQSRNDGEAVLSLKGIYSGIYFLRVGKKTKKFLVVR